MVRRFVFGTTLILVAVLFVFSRCGINNPTAKSGTFTNIWQVTISTECAQCHIPGGAGFTAGATVNFTSQSTTFSTLAGGSTVQATDVNTPSKCQGVLLVSSGHPENSYLVPMVDPSSNVANFGGKTGCTPYPGHSVNLSSAELASISAWITAGAANN